MELAQGEQGSWSKGQSLDSLASAVGHDYPVLAGDGHDLPKRAHVSPPADLGVQKCDFSNIALNRAGNFSVLLLEENSSCHIRSFPVSRLSQETAQLTGVSLQPLPTLLSPQAVSGFTGGSHTAGLWGEAPCGPWPVSFSLASGELHLSTRPPTLGRLWWSSPQPGKPLRGPWTSSCWGHFLAAPPAVKRPSSSPAGHRTPASLRAQQARSRGRGVCSFGGSTLRAGTLQSAWDFNHASCTVPLRKSAQKIGGRTPSQGPPALIR